MEAAAFKRPLFRPLRTEACFCGSGKRFKNCCGSMSEPRQPPYGMHIVHDFLDAQQCRQWVQQLAEQPRNPLGVHNIDASQPSRLSKQHISGRVTDKVEQGELSGAIRAACERAFTRNIPAAMGRQLAWFENPQVLYYEPGGLYGPHADSEHFSPAEGMWQKVIDRDVSLLLYLNDEFEGGELNFRQFNYTYRPRAGDLVFFPSDGRYAHQALPVKSGTRLVIVSWAAWRDEPRVLTMRPQDCIDLPPRGAHSTA